MGYMCLCQFWFPQGIWIEVGLLDHMVFLLLVFKGISIPFPVVAVSVYIPTNGASSVQLLSCVQLFATSWTAARQASLSITNSRSPPKPMAIVSVMSSNHLIHCHPLLSPSIFPSIRVFSNETVLHIRWPKYWSFNFSISPSNEYPGLISFRIDWFGLLAVQVIIMVTIKYNLILMLSLVKKSNVFPVFWTRKYKLEWKSKILHIFLIQYLTLIIQLLDT